MGSRVETVIEVSVIGAVTGNDEEMFIKTKSRNGDLLVFKFYPNANGSAGIAREGDIIKIQGQIDSIESNDRHGDTIVVHRCKMSPVVRFYEAK